MPIKNIQIQQNHQEKHIVRYLIIHGVFFSLYTQIKFLPKICRVKQLLFIPVSMVTSESSVGSWSLGQMVVLLHQTHQGGLSVIGGRVFWSGGGSQLGQKHRYAWGTIGRVTNESPAARRRLSTLSMSDTVNGRMMWYYSDADYR